MHLQKLIGAQRLSEWKGLKVSLDLIKKYNDSRPGKRRNGILISDPDTPEVGFGARRARIVFPR